MSQQRMNRRKFLHAALGAAAGAFIGGAAMYLATPKPGGEITPPPTRAITSYMVAEPGPEALKNILSLFKNETGIDVTLEVYPYPTLQTKQATVLSGESSAVDVVMVDDVWLGQYYESGWVQPIDDLVQRDKIEINFDDFIPGIVEGNMKYKGHLIGLGSISAIFIFYYRTDILEQFGYGPEDLDTWDGVYEVAKAMAPDLKKKGMYPIGLMGARGVQATCTYYQFLGAFGGRVYDPDTFEPEINSDAAVAALEFEAKLAKEVGIPSIPSDDYGELQAHFLNGRIAMMPAWHNMAPVFLLPESPIKDKWEGIQIPKKEKRAPTLGGWCLSISSFSKDKDAAWEFIKWATSADVCVYLAKYQDMSRYSSFSAPSKEAYAKAAIKDLEIAFPRPNIPPWPSMSDLMGVAVNKVLAGEVSAKAALDDLQANYVDVLKKAGYYKG